MKAVEHWDKYNSKRVKDCKKKKKKKLKLKKKKL